MAFLTEELTNRPPDQGLEELLAEARTTGRNDVSSNPSEYGLYSKEAYDSVVAERDARFTQSDIQDAKLGAVVLLPELVGGETQIAKLRFCIEESDDLGNWTTRKEEAEVNIPLLPGKKFYRFLVKENE